MHKLLIALILLSSTTPALVHADPDTPSQPRPTPVTRPEMKRLLEEMKDRNSRIPLPELTPDEAEKISDPRSFGYESRLRSLYLVGTDARGYLPFAGSPQRRPGSEPPRFIVEPDPNVTLDYGFKTRLFWIASRVNNCQYCLGHQESKLLAVGMTDDDLAALDTDWSAFSPRDQAAFAFARRLTLEPHLLSNADVDACRQHFTDLQILEMALSVAGNNAINRWKEGIGVPQSSGGGNFGRSAGTGEEHSYLTPTSEKFSRIPSAVAAIRSEVADRLVVTTLFQRPLPDAESVASGLSLAGQRQARLPIATEQQARETLSKAISDGSLVEGFDSEQPLPGWVRLLAQFPVAGIRLISAYQSTEKNLALDPLLRARIDYAVSRQDGAWYALGLARRQMLSLGQTESQISDFASGQAAISGKDEALIQLAVKLAASPVILTDADVAQALKLAGPRDVTQTIHYTAMRAMFDRFTEAAGIPLDQ